MMCLYSPHKPAHDRPLPDLKQSIAENKQRYTVFEAFPRVSEMHLSIPVSDGNGESDWLRAPTIYYKQAQISYLH